MHTSTNLFGCMMQYVKVWYTSYKGSRVGGNNALVPMGEILLFEGKAFAIYMNSSSMKHVTAKLQRVCTCFI